MRKKKTRRRMFLATFFALAFVGAGILICTKPTRGQYATTLDSSDISYGEATTVYSAQMPGNYDGRYVSFNLASVSVSDSTIASGPAVDGVDYQSYADQISSELSAGAASGTLVVDTSGVSLPLQYDAYLPVTVYGSYNGSDLGADVQYTGTVLAKAGFSTSNADISNADSGVSFGYNSTDTLDGSGGGGSCADCVQPVQQATSFNRLDGDRPFRFMLIAATAAAKGKNYKANAKKWDAGDSSFSQGKIKNYRSNIPNLTDLSGASTSLDTSSVQFDAASGTISVKHKLRIKKAPKTKNKDAAV